MIVQPSTHTRFPQIDAAGSPREIGRAIGEATRDAFPPLVDHVLFRMNQRRDMPITRDQALGASGRFFAPAEAYSPDSMEELRGTADGANVTPEEVMLINARSEVPHLLARHGSAPEGCTTVVVEKERASNDVAAIGQNWDNDPEMSPFSFVITRRPTGKPSFMSWSQAGIIAYMGFSEAGIGVAMNALPGGNRPPDMPPGLPWYFTVRGVYEATSLDGAIAAVEHSTRARSGNLGLVTPQGAADIEVTPDTFRLVSADPDGLMVHTNHCVHPDLLGVNETHADELYGQTFDRKARSHSMLDDRPADISVDDIKTILSDHDGRPTSICRHPNDHPASGADRSVVSIIVEPEAGRMHLTRGNPCDNPYEVYLLD
jgi:isopenicillin-N N-acyltransferase-like protein